jgi:hypothetical protein
MNRIQSGATLHEVFTPTPAVTSGGHYFSYNGMHLTEVASAYDVCTRGKLTNQEHLSSTDTLCMMMCHYTLEKIPSVPNDQPNQKTKKNKKGSDIVRAIEIAKALQQGLGLSHMVQHYPKKGYMSDAKRDFIFEHGNWMDPGEVIDAAKILQKFKS